MSRVISYIESGVWACRGKEFDAMCRVAYREESELETILARNLEADSDLNFETMLAKKGERLNGTRYVEIREKGVAVIDVNGVLAKRMNLFAEICDGGTSTEILLRDFNAALISPNVSSIVLHIDSPGGDAFGINELSQAIYDARGKKTIKAYVSGLGCSGAYWIASACDEIIVDKSAFLGSIGVVTAWTDDSGFYQALGIRREVVTSSNAPFKRLNFDNAEHRQELQRELDSLESVFIISVARNRKVTVEQVKTDFNQGGVLAGVDAVKAKMADRVGNLEQVIKELSRKGNKSAVSTASEGDFEMGFKEDFKTFAAKLGFNVSEKEEENSQPAIEKSNETDEPQLSLDSQKEQEAKIEADKIQQRYEESQAELARLKSEKLSTECAVFISSEISASRMIPAEKKAFESAYLQAAADDEANPLAEGSRLETLKALQSKRQPHQLTKEVLDPKNGIQILAADDNPTAKIDADVEAQVNQYVETTAPKRKLEAVK